jgi:hypothetical protein
VVTVESTLITSKNKLLLTPQVYARYYRGKCYMRKGLTTEALNYSLSTLVFVALIHGHILISKMLWASFFFNLTIAHAPLQRSNTTC